MTWSTFNPPVAPSPGTTNKPEFKTLTVTFGDGYSQESPDGLNSIRDVVNLQWDLLTQAQADTIEGFLKGLKGTTPFYYAMRGEGTKKWTCKDYTRSRGSPNTIKATFRQSFNPVP